MGVLEKSIEKSIKQKKIKDAIVSAILSIAGNQTIILEKLDALQIKEKIELPNSFETIITNELSLKEPIWWQEYCQNLFGLLNEMKNLLEKEKPITESKSLGSMNEKETIPTGTLFKRARFARTKRDIAPLELPDGSRFQFTLPDIPIRDSLELFVGGTRRSESDGDYELIGKIITIYRDPPINSKMLPSGTKIRANYDI